MSPADDPKAGARFSLLWALATLATLTLAVVVDAIVDPHGLIRWVDLQGFNAIKPRASQAGEAFKYRAIEAVRPQALILGNSRAEMGWDPEVLNQAGWGPAVNAAIPGHGLETMGQLADYAWQVSTPRTLVVGVEFFDCLVNVDDKPTHFVPPPSASSKPSQVLRNLAARLEDLLSLDTLTDSIRTVWAQRDPDAPHLRADGFQPAREFPAYARIDGPRKMFLQRDRDNIARRSAGPKSVRFRNGATADCFHALADILDKAGARQQNVFVATYPYHVRLLETISALGLGQAYRDWKVEVVRVVDAARSRGTKVVLRDFSAYHPYAQDNLPPDGRSVPAPKWYWESGHFKSALGDRMLEVMLGKRDAAGTFGTELEGNNVDAHMELVENERKRFESRELDVVAEIRRLVAAQANTSARSVRVSGNGS